MTPAATASTMPLTVGTGWIPLHATPDDNIVPLLGWRFVTAWQWDWIAGIGVLLGLGLYLAGVIRLRRRGDRWPVGRLLHWLLAMALLAFASMGFLGVYDNVLFWVHMVQHMILTMFVGVNIASAAPVTLALRALPLRPRRWLLVVLHSFVAKVLLFPPLTALAMIGYPFALYMTGMYDFTLHNDWAHNLLHLWMVYIGAAFFIPIIGIDPIPNKLPHPLRFLLVLLQMPGHAFIGVIIMGATRLIAEEWYVGFGRTWGPSPQSDQYWAGSILWATGDLTMFTVMTALGISWFRDSQREAARIDRALDRQEELERERALDRQEELERERALAAVQLVADQGQPAVVLQAGGRDAGLGRYDAEQAAERSPGSAGQGADAPVQSAPGDRSLGDHSGYEHKDDA